MLIAFLSLVNHLNRISNSRWISAKSGRSCSLLSNSQPSGPADGGNAVCLSRHQHPTSPLSTFLYSHRIASHRLPHAYDILISSHPICMRTYALDTNSHSSTLSSCYDNTRNPIFSSKEIRCEHSISLYSHLFDFSSCMHYAVSASAHTFICSLSSMEPTHSFAPITFFRSIVVEYFTRILQPQNTTISHTPLQLPE